MNNIFYGIISEVRQAKARVAVNTTLTTDFLPVFQTANSYKVSFSPVRVGEQCVILAPFGDINSGVILRGFYSAKHPLKEGDDKKEVTVYEDGTSISYDSGKKVLEINAGESNINIKCKNAVVKADTVTVDSPSVDLGGSKGKGVITCDSICPFIGSPHHDGSKVVRAVKG